VILSVNRYERKKNIALAVESYSSVPSNLRTQSSSLLVIAGGHDPRNTENIEYHHELLTLANKLDLSHSTCTPPFTTSPKSPIDVLFLHNIPSWLKSHLLSTAKLLVYTPTNEHFGIVPLEAALHSLPVLATPTGGPLETIEDNLTGFLRTPDQWAQTLSTILEKGTNPEMGIRARKRVIANFSKETMAERFERECVDVVERTGGVGSGQWLLKWDLWVGWSVVCVLIVMISVQIAR
jgi:alpha-1,3/alpha-1,6-mannosyltransferase